jgi:glucosamine--fructose-6-phosphate aminotransferase (isomerizing)
MSITADEIATQPELWRRAIADTARERRLLGAQGEKVLVIGCGTSAFVAESFGYLREQAGYGVTDARYASEPWVWRDWDRVIAISRSGTTTEVLAALRNVPDGVVKVLVTGVADSPAAALADEVLVYEYADERSVVQTRFPTVFLIALRAALGEDVSALPDELDAALAGPQPEPADHVVYLGTGWTYGLAQEAALKVREAAQAWSEAYPALDYRHGPLAVASSGSLVWLLGDADDSLVRDIRATGATVRVPERDPLIELVLAQRLAVALAGRRGLDPDTPRHLTRSIILT